MRKYKKILKITDIYSIESLKIAYRNAVKENHPDRFNNTANKELATKKMKLINEAYEYLKQHINNQEDYNEEKIKEQNDNEKYHEDVDIDKEYDYEKEYSKSSVIDIILKKIHISKKIFNILLILFIITVCCCFIIVFFKQLKEHLDWVVLLTIYLTLLLSPMIMAIIYKRKDWLMFLLATFFNIFFAPLYIWIIIKKERFLE